MKKLLGFVFIFLSLAATAQKRIVVLGSSSAAGSGASPGASWAARLQAEYQKNPSDGLDTVITNYGFPGYVTYQAMPTDFVLPANRTAWPQDPSRNVTKALETPLPDIVIINLPSNDVNLTPGYDKKETMDNFRLMFQRISSAGVKCFISTTQPRNDMDPAQKLMLRELRDSVFNNFGVFAINFWDDLVTSDGTYSLRAELTPDNIHPNDIGHGLLFERVKAKNMFSIANVVLPLSLIDFNVQLQNNMALVKWRTEQEEPNTFFEIQKSINGRDFITAATKNATGTGQPSVYSWTDQHVNKGKSYYRLKIIEPVKTSYSKIVSISNKGKMAAIHKIYTDGSELHVDINSQKDQQADIKIINLAGEIIKKQVYNISRSGNHFVLSIPNLAAGEYILSLSCADGTTDTERFLKLK